MNREQKRDFKKLAKKQGFNADEIEYLLNHEPNSGVLWEGAKVKLDTVWIRFSPSWIKNEYSQEYKKFVLDNKDKVFTVVFDKERREKIKNVWPDPMFDVVVCLEEDDSDIKWLMFAGDLILQPGGTPKPLSKEERDKEEEKIKKEVQNQKINEAIQLALKREKS